MKKNTEQFVKSNGVYDFYIGSYGEYYAIAYPCGMNRQDVILDRLPSHRWTQAGFSTKKVALQAIDAWVQWMKNPL